MKDFKVIMNDVLLDHEVAIVDSQTLFLRWKNQIDFGEGRYERAL